MGLILRLCLCVVVCVCARAPLARLTWSAIPLLLLLPLFITFVSRGLRVYPLPRCLRSLVVSDVVDGRRLVAGGLSFVVSVSPSSDVCLTRKMTDNMEPHALDWRLFRSRLVQQDQSP